MWHNSLLFFPSYRLSGRVLAQSRRTETEAMWGFFEECWLLFLFWFMVVLQMCKSMADHSRRPVWIVVWAGQLQMTVSSLIMDGKKSGLSQSYPCVTHIVTPLCGWNSLPFKQTHTAEKTEQPNSHVQVFLYFLCCVHFSLHALHCI